MFSAIVLNTLQLCGIEHTYFREAKSLATAEAQMEPLKGQRGATKLLPHCFVNPQFRLVQDLPISCMESMISSAPYRGVLISCPILIFSLYHTESVSVIVYKVSGEECKVRAKVTRSTVCGMCSQRVLLCLPVC